MADENIIGLAMNLDVSNVKEGVKEVNKIIKSSKDEFNNATAGMDQWSKSSDGLKAKLGQLGKQLDAQNKLVSGYEAEIKRVSELEGDHSEQLSTLKQKLEKAKAEVKKTTSQMSHYGDSLKTVQGEEKKQNSALGKLKSAMADQRKEIADVSNEYQSAVIQYGKNSKEATKLAKKLKTLNKELDDNEDKARDAQKAEENLSITFKDLNDKALEKTVKGVAKIGAAITGLVGGFLATAEATRELRTNMGRVNTAFDEGGFSAEQAKKTYEKFYGLLGDDGQTTEAISHLAKLANTQKDLDKWTNITAGVVGTFGDSLPIESLTEAANETAKVGDLTGALADALNWAGVNEDAFQASLDKCNTEQERQQLITKTLNGLYGEAGKKYKENNKDIIASEEAQARLSQAMAETGAIAEPLMTKVKELGTTIINALNPVIQKIIPFISKNLPIITVLVGILTVAIATMATAVAVAKVKTAAHTTALVAQAAATKAAAIATKAAAAAQWVMNAAMSANPVSLVIIGIAALIAILVTLIVKFKSVREWFVKVWDEIVKYTKIATDKIVKFFKACWTGIKSAWSSTVQWFKNLWNKIKDVFSVVVSFYSNIFSKAWDGIKNAFGKTKTFFGDVFNNVVNAFKNIPSKLKSFFADAWNNIKSAFSNTKKFFADIVVKILDTFKIMPSKIKDVGKNLVQGLWNGISDMTGWIKSKIKGFTDGVLTGIKDFFGIHSPSTEMAEIGGYMAEGLAQGLDNGAKDNKNFITKILEWIKKLFGSGALDDVGKELGIDLTDGAIDELFDSIPDFSNAIVDSTNQAMDQASPDVKKSWKDWFKEITKVDDFSNGADAAEKFIGELERQLNNKQTIAELLGQQFDVSSALEDQNKDIEKALSEMFNISAKEIDESFTTTDTSVKLLVEKYKANVEKIKNTNAQLNTNFKTTFEKIKENVQKAAEKISNELNKFASHVTNLMGSIDDLMSTITDKTLNSIETEINAIRSNAETETETTQQQADDELDALNKKYDNQLISAEEYRDKKAEIEAQTAQKLKAIQDQATADEQERQEEANRRSKIQFEASKALQIAQVWINAAVASIKALADYGFAKGSVIAGLIAATAGVSTATIAAQDWTPPAFAKGGIIDSPTIGLIGEAGKEAIMPLENNTGWIDELANKLNSIMKKDYINGNLQPAIAYAQAGRQNVNYNYNQIINAPKTPSRRELYRDTKNLLTLKRV